MQYEAVAHSGFILGGRRVERIKINLRKIYLMQFHLMQIQ